MLSEETFEDPNRRILQLPRQSLRKLASPTGKPSTRRKVAVQKLGLDIHHNDETRKVKTILYRKKTELLSPASRPCWSQWNWHRGSCFVSDEAGFHLRGYVNSHKSRIWSKAKHLFSSKLPYISKKSEHVLLFLFVQNTDDRNAYWDLISQFTALRNISIVTVGLNKRAHLLNIQWNNGYSETLCGW
jgi:hypothetical protein